MSSHLDQVLAKRKSNRNHQEAETEETPAPRKLDLPKGNDKGIIPSAFSLSSFFVPLSRGPRKHLDRVPLVHLWESCSITYSGYQLDESDRDVLMALILIAKAYDWGEKFHFTRYQIFQIMQLTTKPSVGKANYLWLKESLIRLHHCSFIIERHVQQESGKGRRVGSWEGIHLLTYLDVNETTGLITMQFDHRLAALFDNQQFSLLNLKRRLALKHSLSKSLQALIAASKETTQRYRFDWLILKHDYHLPPWKLKAKFERSCEDLKQAEVILDYAWEDSPEGEVFLRFEKNPAKN